MKNVIITIFLTLAISAACARGAELLVPTQYPTIQSAIDAAADGDTVLVAPGTYTGPSNRDIDLLGKVITVRSENGPETCIIDCNGTPTEPHRGFYFHSGEDANSVVDGLTITNGYAARGGGWYTAFGGGIFCYLSSPTVTNCILRGNSSKDDGGAMANYSSIARITNCTFTENSAYHGGGICNSEGPTVNNRTIVTNCTFSRNSADAGGGIFNYPCHPTVNDCTFSENSAHTGGGMHNSGGGEPTITNCVFRENSAENDGGGIGNNSDSTITNCTFSKNSANGNGGGIYNITFSPTITNCNITGNSADYFGGGIYCDGSSSTITGCTITGNAAREGGGIFGCGGPITNCTIAGNSAAGCSSRGGGLALCDGPITNCTIANNSADRGGGLVLGGEPFSPIKNCIIWNNWPEQIYGDYIPVEITYSDVQGGYPGLGNIDADPCFVDADANDYHLKSEGWSWDTKRSCWTYDDVTSRCIDAGNPGSPLGDELLAVPRDPNNIWGQNLRIDMGAFGGTAEASLPPYDWALLADLTNDGLVDLVDFAFQAADWLNSADQQPGDLNRDSLVDVSDLALLVEDWLGQTTWH